MLMHCVMLSPPFQLALKAAKLEEQISSLSKIPCKATLVAPHSLCDADVSGATSGLSCHVLQDAVLNSELQGQAVTGLKAAMARMEASEL